MKDYRITLSCEVDSPSNIMPEFIELLRTVSLYSATNTALTVKRITKEPTNYVS